MSEAEKPKDPLDVLLDWLDECRDDPYKFVMEAFPWGEPGPLEHERPEDWQRDQLIRIRDALTADPVNGRVRELTLSGHGIGKSAEVSWLTIWAIVTYVDARGVITANTDTQLRTKTWAEVSKWWHLLDPLLQDQFELTATALYAKSKNRDKTWRADAIPNSPTNPAAFAGAHNAGKRLLLILDEGSEIDEAIYETLEGATTDANTQIIFLVYGNPTSPVGAFKERAEGRFRHMWQVNRVDSRKVRRTDQAVLETMVQAWGEDSDTVRKRIKGEFPRAGAVQLIPSDIVQLARTRPAVSLPSDPLILGVDCAREGDDQTVLAFRRGLDARTIPWQRFRNVNSMTVVTAIAEAINKWGVDATMIDMGNIGAAIYDRLLQMNIRGVYPVDFGSTSFGNTVDYQGEQIRVANNRAFIWCKMRMSLYTGLAIPDEADVEVDLTGTEYGYNRRDEILLEAKEHMKRVRKLASPDNGDGLACTYAYPIAPRAWSHPELPGSGSQGPRDPVQVGEYDMFADLR